MIIKQNASIKLTLSIPWGGERDQIDRLPPPSIFCFPSNTEGIGLSKFKKLQCKKVLCFILTHFSLITNK